MAWVGEGDSSVGKGKDLKKGETPSCGMGVDICHHVPNQTFLSVITEGRLDGGMLTLIIRRASSSPTLPYSFLAQLLGQTEKPVWHDSWMDQGCLSSRTFPLIIKHLHENYKRGSQLHRYMVSEWRCCFVLMRKIFNISPGPGRKQMTYS